ncbi:penicillin-binding protein activator, partial [Klebsiella pneumoniae]
YLMRADASQGNQQNDWLIMALKAAIEENNPDQAQLLIMRLAKQPLTPTQQAQWQLLRAQLLANTEQYQEALEQLSFQANWSLPQVQWQQYHQLRA